MFCMVGVEFHRILMQAIGRLHGLTSLTGTALLDCCCSTRWSAGFAGIPQGRATG